MLNQSLKLNENPKNNSFKDYFTIEEESQSKNLQKSISYFNKKRFNEVINEQDTNEIALETKINKQFNENKSFKRNKSLFLSVKDINETNLQGSLKEIGVISSETEQHLMVRIMKDITEEQYTELKNKIIDNELLNQLYDYINNINLDYKNPNSNISIGGISPLSYLIELYYKFDKNEEKNMSDKYNLLKPYIYNYRTIYGDGNCFYRAAIFRYLEILVLNKNIKILQKFIFDVIQSFSTEELQKGKNILKEDIKPELTFKILFIIVDLLKKDKVTDAHQILFKAFSTCRKFDYALILYFRYILYDYIKKNENKIYLESFPILIGNLLPSQYETDDGKFLFDDFYEHFLLKFYKDAEKIVIYLTPFVLGIELDVVVFDIEGEILQKFIFEGKSELITDDNITLLNKKNHYEIIYTETNEAKNKKFFEIFENNIQPSILKLTPSKNEKNDNNEANDANDANNDNDDNDFTLLKTENEFNKINKENEYNNEIKKDDNNKENNEKKNDNTNNKNDDIDNNNDKINNNSNNIDKSK